MKKKLMLVPSLILSSFFALSACSGSSVTSDKVVIRVLNLEDYIYLQDVENGYMEEDLTVQFEKAYKKETGIDVNVIYDTSDTNESEYNDLLTGRTAYDLVCTSDYMIARFVREGLVSKLDHSLLDNYFTYCSNEINSNLADIEVKVGDSVEHLGDYAVGYMWGTLGLLFNPTYEKISPDADPLNDLAEYKSFWDPNYKGTISVKDSMRDAYAVALLYAYSDEAPKNHDYSLRELKNRHEQGLITDEDYNKELSTIFNLTDDDTLKKVSEVLSSLKQNIFGLEVDSGKEDIVTGKIGLNLAWSGDATYSMEQAEEEIGTALYYSIPTTGANIWFDGWAMPKNEKRTEAQFNAAHAFLNFISDPVNAAQNMNYTGYTSFIGGDDIFDLARDWYDIRTDYLYYYPQDDIDAATEAFEAGEIDEETYNQIIDELSQYEEEWYSLYYIDPVDGEEYEAWYEDFHLESESDSDYDEVILYFYNDNDEQVEFDTYNNLLIIDEEWITVDLSYFFMDNLVEYDDATFYTDYYTEDNKAVGRNFYCQYPDEETILRCAVMEDYGDRNYAVLKLWENFKSNSLPLWAIILLIVELMIAALIIGYFIFNKQIKKKLRQKRNS